MSWYKVLSLNQASMWATGNEPYGWKNKGRDPTASQYLSSIHSTPLYFKFLLVEPQKLDQASNMDSC